MSKERLEEIDRNKARSNDDVVIEKQDYYWLIEQAERVQELEEMYKVKLRQWHEACEGKDTFELRCYRLEEQNKRYREAIEGALNVIKYMPSINGSRAMSTILSEALEEEGRPR